MTALANAMKAAGIVSPEMRLREIAQGVLSEYPKTWPSTATMEPRRDGIIPSALREIAVKALVKSSNNWDAAKDAMYAAVRDDAALLWTLFEPYRAIAVQKLLTEVAAEMRAAQAGSGGHLRFGHQRDNAPASSPRAVPAPPKAADTPRPLPHAPREQSGLSSQAGMAAVSNVAKLSVLDTFKIEGRSIGNWNAGAARSWARKTGINVRFVEMLTNNLPAGDKISKWIKPEEAENIMKRAAEEKSRAA